MIFPTDLASEMTGVPPSTLRRWASADIVKPSLRDEPGARNGRWFSEEDLYLIAAVAELGDIGVPLQRRKEAVQCLQVAFERGQQAEQLVVELANDGVAVVAAESLNGSSDVHRRRVELRPIVDRVRERIRHRQERVGLHGKITRTRGVQGSQPVIAGTRVTVDAIQSFARAGYNVQEIMRQYPGLTAEDIEAAIAHERSRATQTAAD